MKKNIHAHKISSYEEDGNCYIRIERILPDSSLEYVTDYQLPEYTSENKWVLFDEIMAIIGKTVGIDSPGIVEHFDLIEG